MNELDPDLQTFEIFLTTAQMKRYKNYQLESNQKISAQILGNAKNESPL